ncbi:MAG: type I-C CRISPR-associated protein Cas8c/Csd1 [Clostridia bacterium]|nr:type I-C CRISPR-associated protein Cas8c/Csd1 [Clostridia bacterium]
MGLLQKAMETYDAMEGLSGVYEAGKEPLAPIGHIVTKAQIEITIDKDGHFVEAKPAEKDLKIIIPVTEESSGRTSSPSPHPLCEQLGYLLGEDKEKFGMYLCQLEQWVQSDDSHPKAAAVLAYIKSGLIHSHLRTAGLLSYQDGKLKNEKDLVSWRVLGLGEESGPVWTDKSLMKAYARYYMNNKSSDRQVCMLSGEYAAITWQHIKGVFSLNGNAKIISANDSSNFTYRGRFDKPDQAASVGYISSQKAHNALKWLISTQGTIHGQRAFVCWNPQGHSVPKITSPLFFPSDDDTPPVPEYRNYQKELRRKLAGYRENLSGGKQVIIASFDAATTGRLAITYYSELLGSDFIDRIEFWDETCCWKDDRMGIYSPHLYNILNFTFGTQRGEDGRVETDDKLIAPNMQRLLACRIDRAAFPLDIMKALTTKAGNLQIYANTNRRKLLFTACAVIRKYYIDHYREVLNMALEPDRKDRSYQWGRLLAVMEKIERDTYDAYEGRETNAIRMQSIFVQRPGYAAKIIMDQLKNAYYPQLRVASRIYYDRLIGEIMENLSLFAPEEYNKPLSETYLPGYYLQKNAFYAKKETNEMEDENNEV